MAMDGLPEGVSPSGRVPEQLLQAAPILKRRRRRNGEGFAKKGSRSGVSDPRGKYRRREESGGHPGQLGGHPTRPRGGRARHPPGSLVVALLLPLGSSGRFPCADFNIIFQEFFGQFK